MIIVIVFGIILFSLVCDVYIYNRILVRHNFGITYRRLFVAYWVVLYLLFGTVLLLYRVPEIGGVELYIRLFMWSIYAMLVSLVPKFIGTLFLLLNDLTSHLLRRKTRILSYIGGVISLVVIAFFVHGATIGRSEIEIKNLIVVSDKIPASFDGYKIAFFSDLHAGTLTGKLNMVEKLVAEINNQKVDLVLNGGDMVHKSYAELTPDILDALKKIEAKDGVFSVLGNHDLGYYYPDTISLPKELNIDLLVEDLGSIGWDWLLDNSAFIYRGEESISLTGHTYPKELKGLAHVHDMNIMDLSTAYEGVDSSSYNITLAHDPQTWDRLLENGMGDLTLSGHVHAMQFKLKFGDVVISPATLMYDRWSGIYGNGDGEKFLYINDGIGCVVVPMRIGVKPELTIITLRKRIE